MSVLVATDLDRTLIYSRVALALAADPLPPLRCVERRDGAEVSFVTEAAAVLLTELVGRAVLVPVSTRLPDQLARVALPGPPSRYAIAANGGVLLVDGEPEPAWDRRVARTLAESAPLSDVSRYIRQHCPPSSIERLRDADGLFCYVLLNSAALPSGFVPEAAGWAQARGWVVSLQGRKLYWVPRGLTKTAAVTEVAHRIGADRVLAAGDSLLDRDLLCYADAGIRPAHGELFDSGWSAPHVRCTAAAGVLAGQEIVEWFGRSLSPGDPAAGRWAG